ncbi:MAG TPA: OmpA family protein [Afifellaceae bacterium]|nr:OmpA family protein [Afifellaceae bacterium]
MSGRGERMDIFRFSRRPARRLILALSLAGFAAGCTTVNLARTPDETNAPAPGFETVSPGSEEDFILNVGRRTYFAKNSDALDATAKRTLDAQAVWLNSNRRWLVKLQGHADDQSDLEADRALSYRRANAVMAYLVSRGVDPNRLWAKGYARERLVRDCADIECKAQNRRVVSNLRTEKDAAAPN